MNRTRLKSIKDAVPAIKAVHEEMKDKLSDWNDKIETARNTIEDAKCDEESAHDNLPEAFQIGEQGEKMMDIISSLEPAVDTLSDALSYIEEALEKC